MSRAFVKEQDGNMPEDDIPERPQSTRLNYVTPRGLDGLRARYDALLAEHAEMADISPDDALSMRRKRELERDIAYFQGRLERAILVEPGNQPADEVRFGASVDVREANGATHQFKIVGEDEADVTSGKVSWVSPLAQALIGAQLGDSVTWHRPAGDAQLTINAIRYTDG
jgi:transcription elongation factor GreB